MFTLKKAALLAAVVVGAASSSAMAGHERYEVRRIPGGPRSDQYVYVRTHRPAETRQRPYALTGRDATSRGKTVRPAMLHPKGPRSAYY